MANRCRSCGAEQKLTEGEFVLQLIWKLFFAFVIGLCGFILGGQFAVRSLNHSSTRSIPMSSTRTPMPRTGQIPFVV